ncbi:MAG: VCBS repeat-containing protein, partial [Saprospiraceae bacterium]|nr:VCBS repeat-containing protein [Saprospiraceae bacterium]
RRCLGLQEILGEKALCRTQCVWIANIAEHRVFTNEAGKRFTAKPLPVQAQFAPINAIISGDFDGDGHADLLLAGNTWSRNISAGQCDAS